MKPKIKLYAKCMLTENNEIYVKTAEEAQEIIKKLPQKESRYYLPAMNIRGMIFCIKVIEFDENENRKEFILKIDSDLK